MSASSASARPVVPALGGLGSPCLTPGRTVRVGIVPRPRIRPLHEVLAATPPAAGPDAVPGPAVDDTLRALDTLATAARPAAVSLCGVLAEILDGRRPVAHLQPLCVDGLYADAAAVLAPDERPTCGSSTRPANGASSGWSASGRSASSRSASSRVSGVRVCAVTPTAAEVSAVLHRDGRARALAARLERSGRRWWLTALVVG